MPKDRKQFEYIQIYDLPSIKQDLQIASTSFNKALDLVQQQISLETKKHIEIADAKLIVSELKDLKKDFDKLTLKNYFSKIIEKSIKPFKKLTLKQLDKETSKEDILIQSEKALRNLKRNIESLKAELGI